MDKPLVTVLSASGACSAPTGSQRLVDVGFEPTEVKRRVERKCRDNEQNSQSVFLSFKCILARNCEGTEQL